MKGDGICVRLKTSTWKGFPASLPYKTNKQMNNNNRFLQDIFTRLWGLE